MPDTILEKLGQALRKIDRPGSFCVSGSVPAVLPGLEVAGLGPVGLPLTAGQAKELKKLCHQAPYGKGAETVVDTSVRRVWRLEPDRFALKNPDWEPFVKQLVGMVQKELGLERQKLESHLYDLLLYEKGSFFLPHRDGEKLERMVATLVVVLPSPHEGGELVVRHDGQEQTVDFAAGDANLFQIHFAAFYADCEHEVRPLRKGYRLCLVYNLVLAKSKKTISAPRPSAQVEPIAVALREWAAEASTPKLVITLAHQYTQDGLAWDTLKGADRARADVLHEAARQAGCRTYLSLLTFHESGSAEYAGGGYDPSYRRRRRYPNDEEDASDYVMGEVFDSSLTASQPVGRDGSRLPVEELDVEEGELLDKEALTDIEPEEDFEGYTGNAGMTLDRWYRHAAILIWPDRRHFEVLCDHNSRGLVPMLEQMVKEWREAGPEEAPSRKAQCLDLAAAILAHWPQSSYPDPYGRQKGTADLLKSLIALDDPTLIAGFLGDVMVKDVSLCPAKSIVAACQKYGWDTFRRELVALFEGTTAGTIQRTVRLLEAICSAQPGRQKGWGELCRTLAEKTVKAVETIDAPETPHDWRIREVKRAELLAGLARALLATEQFDLLARVVAHAQALPEKYPLDSAQVAALVELRPWLKENVKKPCAVLSRWAASCREQLEALTGEAPQPPADFRRPAIIRCNCAHCAELKRFLEDPHEQVHRFSARQDIRNHLEGSISGSRCDLDLTTERRRSPHTLVCTKNTASYKEKVERYRQDQEHLANIRSIEAELPK